MAMRQDTTRARSDKHEQRVAKAVRARAVPGSGSGTQKGDVRLDGKLRIECKTTRAKSFALTLAMLDKIERHAAQAGEIPVMAIQFTDANDRVLREVYVVPPDALE